MRQFDNRNLHEIESYQHDRIQAMQRRIWALELELKLEKAYTASQQTLIDALRRDVADGPSLQLADGDY